MTFPNPVALEVSTPQMLIIFISIAVAVIATLFALRMFVVPEKEPAGTEAYKKAEHKSIMKGVVFGLVAAVAVGVASTQWTMVENPYVKAQEETKTAMEEVFQSAGANVIDDDYSVTENSETKTQISYQGETLNCNVSAKSTQEPIQVTCD